MNGADQRLDTLQSALERMDEGAQGLQQSIDALATRCGCCGALRWTTRHSPAATESLTVFVNRSPCPLPRSVEGLSSKHAGSSQHAEAQLADADARLTALAEQLRAAQEQLAQAATADALAAGLAEAERRAQLLTDNLAARIDQAKAELEHASQSTSAGAQQMLDSAVSQLEQASQDQAQRLQHLQQQLEQQAGASATSLETLRGEVASLALAVGAAGPAASSATDALRKELEGATQQLRQELEARAASNEGKATALEARLGALEGSVKETATAAAGQLGGLTAPEVEKLLGKERAETGSQLDALRAQMQGESKEMVKQGLAGVKAEVEQEVRKDWDERAGQLLGSLERTMHKALDESLDKMKETVAQHIDKELRHRGL